MQANRKQTTSVIWDRMTEKAALMAAPSSEVIATPRLSVRGTNP